MYNIIRIERPSEPPTRHDKENRVERRSRSSRIRRGLQYLLLFVFAFSLVSCTRETKATPTPTPEPLIVAYSTVAANQSNQLQRSVERGMRFYMEEAGSIGSSSPDYWDLSLGGRPTPTPTLTPTPPDVGIVDRIKGMFEDSKGTSTPVAVSPTPSPTPPSPKLPSGWRTMVQENPDLYSYSHPEVTIQNPNIRFEGSGILGKIIQLLKGGEKVVKSGRKLKGLLGGLLIFGSVLVIYAWFTGRRGWKGEEESIPDLDLFSEEDNKDEDFRGEEEIEFVEI